MQGSNRLVRSLRDRVKMGKGSPTQGAERYDEPGSKAYIIGL